MKQVIEVTIKGISPILMHNVQLANPANKFARRIKELTAKKNKKTDEDIAELQKLEWMGGLYLDEKMRPCVPGECIEGAIKDGAKNTRQGKTANAGVQSFGNWPLIYDGPKDIDDLFQDENYVDCRSVKIKDARVMRVRPRFADWGLTFQVEFYDDIVSARELEAWIEHAGSYRGIMDFRPRYGRFIVEKIKTVK